jgi:uncharacterized protein with PQ loop repeat
MEVVGYLAMGLSVLSFAFKKQKSIRLVNLTACSVWIVYGYMIQNNPTIIVNIMVCLVHLYWFINRAKRKAAILRQNL